LHKLTQTTNKLSTQTYFPLTISGNTNSLNRTENFWLRWHVGNAH